MPREAACCSRRKNIGVILNWLLLLTAPLPQIREEHREGQCFLNFRVSAVDWSLACFVLKHFAYAAEKHLAGPVEKG